MRWWFFVGVAHETERMRYRSPLERLRIGVERTFVAIGSQLLPVLRQCAAAFDDLSRALAS